MKDYTLNQVFDEALGRQLDRLIGSRYGINGLELTLGTLSCIILVSKKGVNDENPLSGTPDRYTVDSLCRELEELGLGTGPVTRAMVQGMIRKGYMDLEGRGELSPLRPTLSMAKLLGETFPKLAGMNLLAYLVQILGEAHCGRKSLELAVGQFTQTLRKHGVPLTKPTRSPAKGPEKQNAPEKTEPRSRTGKRLRLSNFIDLSLSKENPTTSIPGTETPNPSSQGDRKKDSYQGDDLTAGSDPIGQSGKPSSNRSESGTGDSETAFPSLMRQVPSDVEPSTSSPFPEPFTGPPSPRPEESQPEPESSRDHRPAGNNPVPSPSRGISPEESPGDSVKASFEEGDRDPADQDVDAQIAAFEQNLAMKCPACKTGRLHVQETATGKTYYRCPEKGCNFISWGKPHHIPCPPVRQPLSGGNGQPERRNRPEVS